MAGGLMEKMAGEFRSAWKEMWSKIGNNNKQLNIFGLDSPKFELEYQINWAITVTQNG